MSVEQIAKATGGETVRVSSGGDLEVSSVSIDTRSSRPGGLFIPLPGTKTDGHVYISDASEKGAAAALVKRSKWREGPEGSGPLRPEMAVILVEDTLVALQTLANRYLSRFPELTRIGITGSNGKTTTKELVGSILSHHAPTMTSAGNYNSEIGVPLSVFEVEPEHRFAVFEMAMNHPGEMDTLADIVRPHAALITNISQANRRDSSVRASPSIIFSSGESRGRLSPLAPIAQRDIRVEATWGWLEQPSTGRGSRFASPSLATTISSMLWGRSLWPDTWVSPEMQSGGAWKASCLCSADRRSSNDRSH
jgi:hypothetical protein